MAIRSRLHRFACALLMAAAVLLPSEADVGAPVVIVGDGVTLEHHASVAGTIAYELACGIRATSARAVRIVTG